MESELDSNDTVTAKPGDLTGEALLRARYLPTPSSVAKSEDQKPSPKKGPSPRGKLANQQKPEVQSEPPGMVPTRMPTGMITVWSMFLGETDGSKNMRQNKC